MEIVVVEKDEVEALRLVDGCHNSQVDAAECMGVSSSTIQRILERAREKLIKAIVHGNALQIKGGDYVVKENNMPRGDGTGPDGKGCGTGRGLGKKSGNRKGGQGKGIPKRKSGNKSGSESGQGQGQGQGRGNGNR
jgi:uncharacterized protein